MSKRHWSDNQKSWGPFTLATRDSGHGYGAMLNSGREESPGCHLRLYGFGGTLLIELPPIIRPWRRKIKTDWDAETVKRLGRDWYWDEHSREYGFNIVDGTLFLSYGPQTHDSLTSKSKCYFLPWRQWRFVRHSLYGLNGELHWNDDHTSKRTRKPWDEFYEAKKSCPSSTFEFIDFDGEHITARVIT